MIDPNYETLTCNAAPHPYKVWSSPGALFVCVQEGVDEATSSGIANLFCSSRIDLQSCVPLWRQ